VPVSRDSRPSVQVSGCRMTAELDSRLPLASGTLTIRQVLDTVLLYPVNTVRYYDCAGTPRPERSTAQRVTLADLGRITLMNPKVSGADAAALLELEVAEDVWAAVPPDADLADADPAVTGGLCDAALALHDANRLRGVSLGKVGKLLHLKRPALFPVLDRELQRLYATRATEQARRPEMTFRGYRRVYWEAVRADLVAWRQAGAFTTLRAELTHDETRSGWAELTDLRLLDITAWSYGKQRTQAG